MQPTTAQFPVAPPSGGSLVGAVLVPAELEARYRAQDLRADGRVTAFVAAATTVLWLLFVPNDLQWGTAHGQLPALLALRAAGVLAGAVVFFVALRTRRAGTLDFAVLAWVVGAAAITAAIQAFRPPDYYLPAMWDAVVVLLAWTLLPNRFAFQAVEAAATTASSAVWLVAFREPLSRPTTLFVGVTLATANAAGAFVSWRMHRSRRLQFLAVQEERAAAEHARQSEELFRTAFENASIGKILLDPSGRIVRVNEAMCRLIGYEAVELVGRSIAEVTHPDDRAASAAAIGNLLEGRPQAPFEKRYVRKDGSVVWGALTTSLVRDPSGAPLRFVGGVMDVTARRQAEAALQESEARFRALAEGAPVGIVRTDAAGAVVYVNRTCAGLAGVTPEAAVGRPWRAFVHAGDRERLHREGREAAEAGRTLTSEYRLVRPDATEAVVRAFAAGLRDREGRPAGHIGVAIDITEERELRERLAVASRLAALGTLVAGVAHEINNPLGSAVASHGFAAAEIERIRAALRSGAELDRGGLAGDLDEVLEALADAEAGERRISAIVKDLSLFGRPDARRARVRLYDVAEGALRWVSPALAVRATIRVVDGGAPDVVASEGQLVQVLANLVTNAAKSIPDGRHGRVEVRLGAAGPSRASIEVVDDGAGMTPDVLRRIFDPFFTTRDAGQGMGLGLAVAHTIVTAHGGTITVTSTPGEGSRFRVELPAAASATVA